MERFIKIVTLNDQFEAQLLSAVLYERNIPHTLKTYHDSAYNGLFQAHLGWGAVYAPADQSPIINSILSDIRSQSPAHELLIFSTESCSVCHAVKPRLIDLCKRYQLTYRLIDTEKQLDFAAQHLVFTVPTVLLIKDGKEFARESRFIDFEKLEKNIKMAMQQG